MALRGFDSYDTEQEALDAARALCKRLGGDPWEPTTHKWDYSKVTPPRPDIPVHWTWGARCRCAGVGLDISPTIRYEKGEPVGLDYSLQVDDSDYGAISGTPHGALSSVRALFTDRIAELQRLRAVVGRIAVSALEDK